MKPSTSAAESWQYGRGASRGGSVRDAYPSLMPKTGWTVYIRPSSSWRSSKAANRRQKRWQGQRSKPDAKQVIYTSTIPGKKMVPGY